MADHPISSSPSGAGLAALSLGGGGARAAYQAGFLRALARRLPALRFPIITGASAGAINAVHLAQHEGSHRDALESLAGLWASITPDQVFRTESRKLLPTWLRWAARLGFGGARAAPAPRAFLDTSPFRVFLRRALRAEEDGRLPGIERNLAAGRLRAVAVTTTDLGSGRTTTWMQGDGCAAWERPTRCGIPAVIGLDHVLASCAVPLFFPAVRLGNGWHGDGGIRQIAPLSPALKLGASRIVAISTRHAVDSASAPAGAQDYPPPAQVLGVLFAAAFHDLLDHDARVLARITALTERLAADERDGLRPARVLLLRPSQDLGALALPHERDLPGTFRFMIRGLGTREARNVELLSLLLLQPGYTSDLMALGERDAEAKGEEVEAFLAGR